MFKNIRHRRFIFRILMDIHEYTLWEVGYCGSLQDIANILEYPQEQVLFSGQCFFPFFETLCFAKSVRKQCFSHFFRFLRDVHQKVWENSVFSRFSRHFVQSSQKMRKTAFFEHFARRSSKSVRKQCFFTFFETLCTKFAKNAKKQRYLSFLRDVHQKVWENSVFSRFSWHVFVQSSQKNAKKQCFLSFLRKVPPKVW